MPQPYTLKKKITKKNKALITIAQIWQTHVGASRDRNGGGPPSSLRAAVKVLHGVPQCKKNTRRLTSTAMSWVQKAKSMMSCGEVTSCDGSMSTGGKVGTPCRATASVIPALPAKSSRK
jgi:hypothetical protein